MGNRSKFRGIGMSSGKGSRHSFVLGNRAARRAWASRRRHNHRAVHGRPHLAWSWNSR